MDHHPFPAALAACALATCLAATLVAANRRRCLPDIDRAEPPAGEAVPPTLRQQLAAALRDGGGSLLGLPISFVQDLLRDDGQAQISSTVVLHRPYVAALADQLEQCTASGAWPELVSCHEQSAIQAHSAACDRWVCF